MKGPGQLRMWGSGTKATRQGWAPMESGSQEQLLVQGVAGAGTHQMWTWAWWPRPHPRCQSSLHQGLAAAKLPRGLSSWEQCVCWFRWALPMGQQKQLAWHLRKAWSGLRDAPHQVWGSWGTKRRVCQVGCCPTPQPCPVSSKRKHWERHPPKRPKPSS